MKRISSRILALLVVLTILLPMCAISEEEAFDRQAEAIPEEIVETVEEPETEEPAEEIPVEGSTPEEPVQEPVEVLPEEPAEPEIEAIPVEEIPVEEAPVEEVLPPIYALLKELGMEMEELTAVTGYSVEELEAMDETEVAKLYLAILDGEYSAESEKIEEAEDAANATVIASGDCGADGDDVAWTLYSDGKLVISGTGRMRDAGELGDWPWLTNELTSVEIGQGVTYIGGGAFETCYWLTSVTIPSSVSEIGGLAFHECESLTSITIPSGVRIIGHSAFEGCINLASIEIPDRLTNIDDYAFSDCSSLTNITIPGSVTYIGEEAFEGCDALTISVYSGSYAEQYCIENNLKYEAVPVGIPLKTGSNGTYKLNIGEQKLFAAADGLTAKSWKSSYTKYATVAGGLVTAIKAGTTTITVKFTNGKTGTVKVTVVDPYKPTSVKLDQTGTVKLDIDKTLQLTATLAPETAAADSITWKSSYTKYAKVAGNDETCVVTPVAEGTTTITVTVKRGSTTKTASVKVKVVDPYKPTGVTLDKTGTVKLYLAESETLTLVPSVQPETALVDSYTWKSSATKYATVNADGVVTPVKEGTATITVTAKRGSVKKTASVKVKVVDPYKPSAVKLEETGTVQLALGETKENPPTLQLHPVLVPSVEGWEPQATVTWKSSSSTIAKVDAGGIVTPLKEGTATITVTAKRGSVSKTATVKVKVVDPYKPSSVKLSPSGTQTLYLGGEGLPLTMTLTTAAGSEGRASLTWKSSSTKIAKVDANGVVTPVKAGTATITVTAKRYSTTKTASMKVKVVDPYKPTALTLTAVPSAVVEVGGTIQIVPTLTPETAIANFTYKSSSTSVATVSTDGVVTGKKKGTATITVTATRGSVKLTKTIKVTVLAAPAPTVEPTETPMPEQSNFVYRVNDAGTGIIIEEYLGNNAHVVVGGEFDGLPVVEIGESAFEGNVVITSVDLPDTVQIIGKRAFANCANLKEMN